MRWWIALWIGLLALVLVAPWSRPTPMRVLEVHVLDRTTRRAVAHPELRWLTATQLAALDRPRGEDRAETLRRFGRTAASDVIGRARLALRPGDEALHVAAFAGRRYGTARLDADAPSPQPLEVAADEQVVVSVVGAEGAPAQGLPVALFTGGSSPLATARTDAAGRAVLRHVQDALPRSWRPAELFVDFPFPTRERHAQAVGPAARAGAIVQLVAPETGSVELRVVGVDGRPLPGPSALHVQRAGGDAQARTTSVQLEDGRGLLEHVEVGLPLLGTMSRSFEQVELDALPRAAGERVTATVRVDARTVELRGRALGPDGAPLAGAALTLEVWTVGGIAPRFALATADRGGRFALRAAGPGDPRALELLAVRARGLAPPLEARLDGAPLAAALAGDAALELGDVTLAAPPLAARGRVVDDAGRPVAGAELWLRRRVPRGRGSATVTLDETRADADGRFALHAAPGEGEDTLGAARAGLLPASVALAPGADRPELELTLERSVRVEGRIETAGLPRVDALLVTLTRRDEPRRGAQAAVDPDGGFVLEGLAPGAYDARVTLDARRTLSSVPVELDALPVARPPELARLDLSDVWRAITVEVVDEAGAPLAAGWVSARAAEHRLWRYADRRPLDGAPLRLEVFERPLVVEACAEGRAASALADVDGDVRLTLGPGLALDLYLDGGLEPPPPPAALRAELTPPPDAPQVVDRLACTRAGRDAPAFGLDGWLRLRLPVAGAWTLTWWLDPGDGREALRLRGAPTRVEVGDGAPREAGVAPDPARLRAARAALGLADVGGR